MKKLKKGFTIVELVIVIAVIAILAGVLIPVFSNVVDKANKSKDTQLVRNLNEALAVDLNEHNTMYDALQAAKEFGYDVDKINASATDNEILWDSVNDCFVYLNAKTGEHEYIPGIEPKSVDKHELWIISNTISMEYSTYYTGSKSDLEVSTGFDAGENTNIKSIKYKSTETQDVVIRTNGDQVKLVIEAPNSNVDFYGFAKEIDVTEVKGNSLHIYGSVNQLKVTKGHVEVEETGIIFKVTELNTTNNASITNAGYIATVANGIDKEKIDGNGTISGDFEISTLAQLEAFRDAVNAGNNFSGLTVKLTKDITLKDGWKPIGEGGRKVVATNTLETGTATYFEGAFDGQNHTISNLNNKGFEPTQIRIAEDTYAYGLFALVGDGAEFRNLKLANVDFDGSRYSKANADSVGALVGYANGNLTVDNITVSGSLKGTDAMSGVVGRINVGAHTIIITNCVNNADVTADVAASGIVRFYQCKEGSSVTLTSNTNNGTITSLHKDNLAGGISCYMPKNATLNFSGNMNKGNVAIEKVTTHSGNSILD